MKTIKDLIKKTNSRVSAVFTQDYKKTLYESVRFFSISVAILISLVVGSAISTKFVQFVCMLGAVGSFFAVFMGGSMILDSFRMRKSFQTYEHPGYLFSEEHDDYTLTPDENKQLMSLSLNTDQQNRIIEIVEEKGKITYLDLFAISALIDKETLIREKEEEKRSNFLNYCRDNGISLEDLKREQEMELGNTPELEKML